MEWFRGTCAGLLLGVSLVGMACGDEKSEPLRLESKRSTGSGEILVKVNGQAVTRGDLERVFVLRMIPAEMQAKLQEQLLGQMIDAKLMRQYLLEQKVKVPEEEVERQIQRLETMLSKRPDSKPILAKLNENKRQLREEISVPLMWREYQRKAITDEVLIAYFEQHKEELDGTKIRVSHILLKCPPGTNDEEAAAKEKMLTELRVEIASGKTSFEQAAEVTSEAPSGKMGGDIGAIAWEGVMPDSFCAVAFKLPIGEVSEPFRTHFGWHLCVVKEKIPGDLSVEDVRKEIFARVSQEAWEKKLEELRAGAKIEVVGK